MFIVAFAAMCIYLTVDMVIQFAEEGRSLMGYLIPLVIWLMAASVIFSAFFDKDFKL